MSDTGGRAVRVAWAAYFVIAPVFWLPITSAANLDLAKPLLFAFAVGLSLTRASSLRLGGGRGIEWVIAVALASIPALLQTSSSTRQFRWLLGIVLAVAAVLAFESLRDGASTLLDAAFVAGVGIGVLSLVVGSTLFVSLPFTGDVAGLEAEVANAGFSTSRTEWSNAIALFVPILLYYPTQRIPVRVVGVLAAGAISLSQFAVGGRTGLTVTVLTALAAASRYGRVNRSVAIALAATGLVVLIAVGGLETPTSLARGSGQASVEEITTGRSAQWSDAASRIADRPLRGTGFGTGSFVDANGQRVLIHNLWLRIAVDGGIALSAIILASLVMATVAAVRTTDLAHPLVLVLFAGLFMSLVEPSALIGAFNKTPLFWCAIGATLSLRWQKRSPQGT